MWKWILNKWDDPVWSKVFAGVILAAAGTVVAFISGLIRKIPINKIASQTIQYLKQHHIEIDLLTGSIILFLLLVLLITGFGPIWRFIKKLLNIGPGLIFYDNFSTNFYYWELNYWGSANPPKTNRIENKKMIFEATAAEWQNIYHNGEMEHVMT